MKLLNLLLFFIFCLIQFGYPQEPTKWRGPGQSGIYMETGLLQQWPAEGPDIIWTYDDLGDGYAAPAFANNRIYVSGMEDTKGYIYSFSENGTLIWKTQYGIEFESSYPGSRSTPVIVGEHLYILSAMGDLACMDAISGNLLWKKNLVSDFGGYVIEWGYNETMVVHNNMLICTPGGRNYNMIALDRLTGNLIWTTKGKGEKSAYCTPLLTKVGQRNLLVTHTENNIIGVDADNGKFLWSYPHPNKYSVHPNTPVTYNNQVFGFSGYGMGGVMLQLNEDGSKVSKKWFSESMDGRIGGAVVLNGKLYGSGDTNREWQCIDWNTGKVEYSTTDIGNGVIISADNLLYFYSQRGELALVKPGTSSFDILSEAKVKLGSGQHWAHPVINNGTLYIRHGDTLIAFNIKK